ncbi:MAG: hypothetical protein L0Y56_10055 [Nitrospira sp.]|nr:hypothetical protein [Nitrospira sp.]
MIRMNTQSAVVEQLYIRHTDILFHNTEHGQVVIEVAVHNPSAQWSLPTTMVVQAAPLGAFVPWRHLTSVEVPEVEPWGQVQVETQVFTPRSAPLGDLQKVTPQQIFNALDQPQSVSVELFGRLWGNWPLGLEVIGQSDLPDDLMVLLGRPNPHWAGNINVFIGDCAVERHRAQALRIYPGRTNLAMFLVGSGTDRYAFHFTGVESDWEAKLYSMMSAQSLVDLQSGYPISPLKWIDGHKVRLVQLAICPPKGCRKGEVEVHVTQKSTRKSAVIEFSLDPHAAGPGRFAI